MCKSITPKYYQKEFHQYHQALGEFLQTHTQMNQGLMVDQEGLRHQESQIQAFLRARREERWRGQRARTTGPILKKEEWQKAHLGIRPPRRIDDLRCSDDKRPDWMAEGMLSIITGHFKSLFQAYQGALEGSIDTYLAGIWR